MPEPVKDIEIMDTGKGLRVYDMKTLIWLVLKIKKIQAVVRAYLEARWSWTKAIQIAIPEEVMADLKHTDVPNFLSYFVQPISINSHSLPSH